MTQSNDLLDLVFTRLRASFGGSVQVVERAEDRLDVHVGRAEDAILSIQVDDPNRPSFIVSYPAVRVGRDGSHHVDVSAHRGVLVEAIEGSVRQLLKHGVVMPELF